MERLKGLSLGRKLILGSGVLLLLDTFLNWQSISVGVSGVTVVSAGQSAWHGFWGVLLGLLTLALLLWVGARAFGVALPATIPDGLATLAVGGLIVLFALLKTVTESYSAWPSYVGIVLGAGVAYGAWLVFQESGESLPRVATATAGASAADARGAAHQAAGDEPPSAAAGTDLT
jgi:hypothetical protein